jgi:hypothetical protein
MEADFIDLLLTNGGVAAIVGDRVWPVSRPQGSPLPDIIVTRITGGPEYADDGEVGLERTRIQVDMYAVNYTQVYALQAAVRATLSAFSGVHGSTDLSYITLEDQRSERGPGDNAAEYLFRISCDYIVWVRG